MIRRHWLLVALAAVVVDRLSKLWLLDLIDRLGPIVQVTSFFNLVHVWNPGVSFSMLQFDPQLSRWLLSALAFIIVAGMVAWLGRSRSAFEQTALGLIVGGALGNVVDRIQWGAVADFFDAHAFGYHWPAFNLADSAIVVGVAVLLGDQWLRRQPGSEQS